MAVTTFGVVASDIDDEVAWADIDGSSDPTATTVTAWITDYAAELGVSLLVGNVTPSGLTAGTEIYEACASALKSRVATEWLSANTRELDEYLERRLEQWDRFLELARSGALAGTEDQGPPGSRVKGAFDSAQRITRTGSVDVRRGSWRKGRGFH